MFNPLVECGMIMARACMVQSRILATLWLYLHGLPMMSYGVITVTDSSIDKTPSYTSALMLLLSMGSSGLR